MTPNTQKRDEGQKTKTGGTNPSRKKQADFKCYSPGGWGRKKKTKRKKKVEHGLTETRNYS